MEPCTHERVLLTTLMPPRLLQALKVLEKISGWLKLWIYSLFNTQILVNPHLKVQHASSGSIESTRSLVESLLTRHESVTCHVNSIDDIDRLPPPVPLSEPLPDSQTHIQIAEDEYRDGELPEEDLKAETDHTAPRHGLATSQESALCTDSSTVLSWTSDTPSPPLTTRRQSVDTCDRIDGQPCVDTLRNLSSVVVATHETENNDQACLLAPWVKRDVIQDTLDTGCRIVITPPNDSWETFCYNADNNRIGLQYLASLVVPPFYLLTSRLIKYEEWMAHYYPPVQAVSHDQLAVTPSRTSSGPLVFSPSGFQKHLQELENDRISCGYIVTALRRHQLKAIAFAASLKACLFRMRYDIPGFLESVNPRFKWIDPAEILIESFRHTPHGITIYTSPRPCSVPHIAIHESPPNDPYVVWNNALDPQNNCFLGISSPNRSLWNKDNYYSTDTPSSLCDSPPPATPKDFSNTLEQNLDILFNEQYNDHYHQQYELEEEFVVTQYSEPGDDTTFPSKSEFSILDDDDEDGLPPLDDWYITIANRCMRPEEAEAVTTAAAVSLPCH